MAKFIINYPDSNDPDVGIIPFFHQKGLLVSYLHTNIFELLQKDPQYEAQTFLAKYPNDGAFVPYYKLMDMLAKQPIRTVFCLCETDNGLLISKGAKKLIAMAVNGLTMATVIVVGTKLYGTKITSDGQLYDLLFELDPTIKTIRCDLIEPRRPAIHVLENAKNVRVWRDG